MNEAVWVKCHGEAHSPAVAGNMDHCMVCAPWWEEWPECPDCRRRLIDTTTDEMHNRQEPMRLWCRTCRKHVGPGRRTA